MKDIFSYFLGGMAVAMVIYLFVWMMTPTPQPAKIAHESYLAGENASTVGEKKDQMNRALEEYKKLEAAHDPVYGNGVLYYDIGNSYYQLEAYPWAVYYYYKALKLAPTDTEVRTNLDAALSKLNLPAAAEPSFFERLFLLRGFSLPTRFQLFFFSSLIFFAALSAYFWLRDRRLLNLAVPFAVLGLYFFLNTAYDHYMAPLDGVLVKASSLYRDAGDQSAKVSDNYLTPGLKVEVLDQRQNGQWLKILTPSGDLGYIPADSLQIL